MSAIPSSLPAVFETALQKSSSEQSPAENDSSESAAVDDAATEITISPEARAAFARLESERVAVEELVQILLPDSNTKANETAFDKIASALSHGELTFDDLTASPETGPEVDEDSSPFALSSVNQADMDAKLREMFESFVIGNAERHSAEGGQAAREAIKNGTAQVRKAADVVGLDYESTVTHTEGPGGKGTTVRTNSHSNHSPEIQAEIDSGHGLAMWTQTQGDVYITW